MKAIVKNTSFQTFALIAISLIFGQTMPLDLATAFYTISLFLKDLLLLFLPFAVFVFIATTLNHFEKRGWLLVIVLILFEMISNGMASISAYGLSFVGSMFYGLTSLNPIETTLTPLFSVSGLRPSFWRVEYGTLLGVILGLLMPYISSKMLEDRLQMLRKYVTAVFIRGFSRVIPLFVLGFFLNLMKTTNFFPLLVQGGSAIGIMLVGLVGYILILYLFAAGFSPARALLFVKNAFPAGFTAFSSMSSAATMPVTIQVTEKNLQNPAFASMVIPATTNIQQIGDCFINVFLCCVILYFFGLGIPDLGTFMLFLSVFILARFTTAAVIGGAIFIMLPIYQNYLGFNEEMTALILAFNMLLDPIVTATNVMANSALCVIFERVWSFIMGIHSSLKWSTHNEEAVDES